MNGISELYKGADMAQVMYGKDARHIPAWMYVQGHGNLVSFVGASRMPEGTPHPLAYGRQWPINFMVGELIVRPHIMVGTRVGQGDGLGGLATSSYYVSELLADGELIAGSEAALRRIREQSEG